jgi:membrane-bound lytic murein transglycosylase D
MVRQRQDVKTLSSRGSFMKNFRSYSVLAVSSLFLLSCSLKRAPLTESLEVAEVSKPEVKTTKTVSFPEDEVFEKAALAPAEYSHEIVEADADDLSIKQAVGVSEIDEDLNPVKESGIPFAPKFLKPKNTKRVQFWVDYFTRRQRDRFQRFINNGEEYRHHIEEIFVKQGLPKELYFVGLIESGYYLGARSHAAAVGPWQFIKGTGKRYGLRMSHELDERQDLFKATHAAAAYFRDLHNIFSSWELSLAAYNAGEYGMIRRILKYGTRDFYQLSRNKQLPSETINYVPKVLAAMHIVNNAEKYGFVIPKKQTHLFDLTELRPVKKNVHLRTVARKLGVQESLIKKLNPELRKNSTPRQLAGTYFLRVPKGNYNYKLMNEISAETPRTAFISRPETRKEFNRRIATIADEPIINRPRYHKVRKGDTLFSVARKYKTSPLTIARVNNFKSGRQKLRAGSRLNLRDTQKVAVMEEQKVSVKLASPKVRIAKGPLVYRVTRGDNLTELAKLFNLKVREIKSANKMKRATIHVGQRIVLPDTQKGIYTVKHGDHLYKVARELNRPVEALVKLNSLKRKAIYPGQKIIVNMD